MSAAALFGWIALVAFLAVINLATIGVLLHRAGNRAETVLEFDRFRMAEKVTAWVCILAFGVWAVALVAFLVLGAIDLVIWFFS